MADKEKTIGVIGLGNYGRGLCKRLAEYGFQVIVGRRDPQVKDLEWMGEVCIGLEITSIPSCIGKCDIIFLATPAEVQLPMLKQYEKLLARKIIVDVSNPFKKRRDGISHAEYLSKLLPESIVVKGFNTVSAASLDSDTATISTVTIATDEVTAKHEVFQVARRLGFIAVDGGNLKNAFKLEAQSQTTFKGWGNALIATAFVFSTFLTYGGVRYFHLRNPHFTPDRIPANFLQKVFACSGLNLLAIVYLAGCVAGIAQMINGTKYKQFPSWLDTWLKIRKHLGLLALYFAFLHFFIIMAIFNPAYYTWFQSESITIPANQTSDLTFGLGSRLKWYNELSLLLAVLATTLMILLGVTSLPSVASSLNWREWRLVQSYGGITCLFLSTAHVTAMGLPGWINDGPKLAFTKLSLLSTIIPWLTLFIKLVLFLPCFSSYISKIRDGWQRKGVQSNNIDPEVQMADNFLQVKVNGINNEGFITDATHF